MSVDKPAFPALKVLKPLPVLPVVSHPPVPQVGNPVQKAKRCQVSPTLSAGKGVIYSYSRLDQLFAKNATHENIEESIISFY